MENWKEIKGYENEYQVSDLGRIKRLKGKVNSGLRNSHYRTTKEVILKQHLKRNGYLTVDLSKNGIVKTISVHRIVAINFIPNDDPENKKAVDHINCIKTDNRVCNLEWVSNYENSQRAKQNHLTYAPNKKPVRNKQLNKIFTSSYDAANYINNIKYKNAKIVKSMAGKIRSCCCGWQKSAYGYTWEYVEGSTTNS